MATAARASFAVDGPLVVARLAIRDDVGPGVRQRFGPRFDPLVAHG